MVQAFDHQSRLRVATRDDNLFRTGAADPNATDKRQPPLNSTLISNWQPNPLYWIERTSNSSELQNRT